jgi:hypothetical protein
LSEIENGDSKPLREITFVVTKSFGLYEDVLYLTTNGSATDKLFFFNLKCTSSNIASIVSLYEKLRIQSNDLAYLFQKLKLNFKDGEKK